MEPDERRYLESARVGRLATADADARPHVVPVCFALLDDERIVTAVDEKPQDAAADALKRSRDVEENPYVALVVDHYTEEWADLGWLQVRGTATHLEPGDDAHADAVDALREKYAQYEEHALEERPMIRISVGSVVTWGELERPGDGDGTPEAGGE